MMLTILILVPILGALVLAFMPRRGHNAPGVDQVKGVAFGFAMLTLVVSMVVMARYDVDAGGYQMVEQREWIRVIGAHYALGVNGIGLVMVLLTTILVPIVIMAAWEDRLPGRRSVNSYLAWMLLLEALAIAAFCATDVFLFYVVFEASLIPLFFLIGAYGGGEQRERAAVTFLIYNLVGGLLMLAAIVGLYVVSSNAGGASYLLSDLTGLDIDPSVEKWLFVGFMAAFVIKAPLAPFHSWLPDAAQSATPGTAVLMVSVIDKLGTFGMLRWCLEVFPGASQWADTFVMTLAVISILYGALMAMGADDLRRLIAWTSVSHFGFIVLGIFALTTTSASGSVLYMFNHGMSTAALFILIGWMVARRGSADIGAYGGLQKITPILSGLLLIAGLSSLSLPGLAPFVSEFMVLAGSFSRSMPLAVAAAFGIVLAAVYVLRLYSRTMNGPLPDGLVNFRDLGTREAATMAPVVVLIVALGFFPQPMLNVVNPAVETVLAQIGVTDPPPRTPANLGEGVGE